MTDTSSPQFSILTDTIAHRLLRYPDLGSAEEPGSALEEFASYLASEAWSTLPDSVRTATHETKESVPSESEVPLDTLSPAFVDTLVSYGIAGDDEDAAKFLYKVLAEYIEQATAPPPVWSSTRAEECEICERDVPLTYHHLIPKSVHAKALKRRWHPESMLNSVAWKCIDPVTTSCTALPVARSSRSTFTPLICCWKGRTSRDGGSTQPNNAGKQDLDAVLEECN